MIKKLLKYDLKKMTRILIYIYIIAVGLAGITRLINIGKNIQAIAIIGYVFSSLTYSALASILVNTFVQILRVFVVNFYKDESYLTHTLPVKKSQLLLSKYLSSLIVIVFSVAVCVISLFIMFYSNTLFLTIRNFVQATVSGFNMPVWLFVGLVILVVFSQICAIISMAFAAVIKANTYNHKRVIKGLLWFAVFYFGSIIATLLMAIVVFALQGNLSQLLASVMSQSAFISILIIGLLTYIAYSIIFYLISKKLFNKGVNVD